MNETNNYIRRPDTYFLQEAVNRGLEATIARLDRDKDYLRILLCTYCPSLI